jgi:GntR family transcriptional regulator
MLDESLRRGIAIPLYFQLQELLKEKIEAGTWRQGEAIPSEPELCELYGVSRTVVRQALSVLEQDGQLRRVRGRGTFVSTPKIQQRVGGITRLLVEPAPGHSLLILDHRREQPARRVREQLELGAREQILRVMSLLRIGGAPVALFDSFFTSEAAGSISERLPDNLPSPPRAVRRRFAPQLSRTTVAIETSFCSPWEAEQLQIPVRGAVFVTSCTEYAHGKGRAAHPFEVVRSVYRVDRVQLSFDVSTDGETPAALWSVAGG